MTDFLLAHDLGTTGNKATLIDAAGHPVASVFESYATAYPHPNWAEQDARDWQRAGAQADVMACACGAEHLYRVTGHTWKARLIEEDFQRLMFETENA